MKTVLALLGVVAVLAIAAPAGARPIDEYGPIPSDGERVAAPAPASGTETWVVVASVVLAFAAGAGAARLVPVPRLGAR